MTRRVLDLGCGRNKQPGAVGADRNPASQADLLCDLDRVPFPFRGDAFDEIHLHHVVEHLADVIGVTAELWRIGRDGCRVLIATPHFSSVHSYTDPGHRQRLGRNSFDQVRKELLPGRRIEVVRKEIRFHHGYFWSWPARLIYRISPNKYEKFFTFLFPARELVFELVIVKGEAKASDQPSAVSNQPTAGACVGSEFSGVADR